MATLKTQESSTTEVEVTPDYCFQKAAENLSPMFGIGSGGGNLEAANQWRELGLAIHATNSALK